jgi:hypothetical protein
MPQPKKYASDAEKMKAYRARQAGARLEEREAKGLPAAPRISTMPGYRRWDATVIMARALLELTVTEMETYRDERSEAWQESDKAEYLQTRIDAIEEALTSLEGAM